MRGEAAVLTVEQAIVEQAIIVADSPPRLGSDPNFWGGLLLANSDEGEHASRTLLPLQTAPIARNARHALLLALVLTAGCAAPEPPAVVRGTGGAWEKRASLGTVRQEHAVVAVDVDEDGVDGDVVVVVGGFDDNTTLASVESYDPRSDRWRSHAPLPLPLHHGNVGVVDGRVVLAGFLVGADFRADGRVFVADADLGAWRAAAPMPAGTARGAAATCVDDDAVYVFGGIAGGSSLLASRYLVADDRWEPLPPLPQALDHLLCGVDDSGDVVIVGGRANGLRNHTDAVLAFSPSTQTYTQRAPMPTSRAGAAGVVVDGAFYVVGGEGADSDTGVFAAAERYTFAGDVWESVVDMRTPRHGMGAAAVDGVVYVPGGAAVQGFGAGDVNEAFVPD